MVISDSDSDPRYSSPRDCDAAKGIGVEAGAGAGMLAGGGVGVGVGVGVEAGAAAGEGVGAAAGASAGAGDAVGDGVGDRVGAGDAVAVGIRVGAPNSLLETAAGAGEESESEPKQAAIARMASATPNPSAPIRGGGGICKGMFTVGETAPGGADALILSLLSLLASRACKGMPGGFRRESGAF